MKGFGSLAIGIGALFIAGTQFVYTVKPGEKVHVILLSP